jgi:proline racemase
MRERIKRAVKGVYTPVYLKNEDIRGVSILEFTEPMRAGADRIPCEHGCCVAGEIDHCPCGTGSCVRMAVLHAREQLAVGEVFEHCSIIGSTFDCYIRGTTKVGDYEAVLPTVKGSAWITGYKEMVLDSTDPFPLGFRVGDQWHVSDE